MIFTSDAFGFLRIAFLYFFSLSEFCNSNKVFIGNTNNQLYITRFEICRWKYIIARRCQRSPKITISIQNRTRRLHGSVIPFSRTGQIVSLQYVSWITTRFWEGKWRTIIIIIIIIRRSCIFFFLSMLDYI